MPRHPPHTLSNLTTIIDHRQSGGLKAAAILTNYNRSTKVISFTEKVLDAIRPVFCTPTDDTRKIIYLHIQLPVGRQNLVPYHSLFKEPELVNFQSLVDFSISLIHFHLTWIGRSSQRPTNSSCVKRCQTKQTRNKKQETRNKKQISILQYQHRQTHHRTYVPALDSRLRATQLVQWRVASYSGGITNAV
jgi:hypothetical protein